MLFYKAECLIPADNVDETEDRVAHRREFRAKAHKIKIKCKEFNERFANSASFYFVADLTNELLTLGIITDDETLVEQKSTHFLKYLEYQVDNFTLEEVTINTIESLLDCANNMDFIDDNCDILEKFGFNAIRRTRHLTFGENLIESRTKKAIYGHAKKHLLNQTFIPELDRIFAIAPSKHIYGHPVHYMFQTDDLDVRREASKILLQSLYVSGRLRSRRYAFLDFKPGDSVSRHAFDSLYKMCAGGAVVIRYLSGNFSEENGFASGDRYTIETICETAKHYHNDVLTIICFPRECKKFKSIFYENLGNMTFIELEEDLVACEKACDFLKMLAKEKHIRTDKTLFSKVDETEKYLAPDLRNIFDEWYNKKLKTTVFPQYKDFAVAKEEVVRNKPKGCAYDELQSMIGLSEAKSVIQKALNYYKIQKLYEEKGLKRDNPAMHMVFSGNPGTAKTSVARLFAQIMRDNGLISKGHLVEVGRGDLVGKYVGWTAQTVQEKFKEASGGVLFIDEAYSLVDGHSGSYGDEAINTIVQEMENHRDDVVVIFAGYPKEMESFLQKNPGLRSRVAFHVPFDDYNAKELCDIARLISKNKGITIEDDAILKLEDIFTSALKQSDFGNGRYVRNIIEQAKMNQATRLIQYDFNDITTKEITTIKSEDIIAPPIPKKEKRTIGFA